MGRPFKIKTQRNVKATKKPELDLRPMKSPYVKDKPEKIYPIFFNFNEQWEPDTKSFVINEPSQIWGETGKKFQDILNDKYDLNIFPDWPRPSGCCTWQESCMCKYPEPK